MQSGGPEEWKFQCGEAEVAALADALAKSEVERLEIRWGRRKENGSIMVKAVAKWLKACEFLTDLNFSDNRIGSKGAQALSEAFEGKSPLTNINLADNMICDELLQESMTLRKMDLSNKDGFSYDMEKALVQIEAEVVMPRTKGGTSAQPPIH